MSKPSRGPADEPATGPGEDVVIGRNASFRLGSQIASTLINVLGMVLLANRLSAEGYGRYAFYYALIPLIASVADAGIGLVVTREISRDRWSGPRLLGDAILIRAALSVLMLGLVAGVALPTLDRTSALLLLLVTATALLDYGQDPAIWVLRAHERMGTEALLLLLSQGVWIVALGAGLTLDTGLAPLLAAATLAFATRLIAGAIVVTRRLYAPRFQPQARRWRRLLCDGLPFGAAMFVVVLYGRVGVLLLQWLATPGDVAKFHVAYLLTQPLGFIASALTLAAFPALARHAMGNPAAVERLLRRASKYQLIVTLPLTAGLVLLAGPLVARLFHRPGFEHAAGALRILAAGLTFIFLNLMARYVLVALDRQGRYLGAVLVGLAVNAAVGLALIPRMGFRGACLAFVAAELAITMVCARALARYVRPADLLGEARKPLAATVVMVAAVLALRGASLGVVAIAGTLAYGAALVLLRVLEADERAALRDLALSLRLRLPGRRAPSPAVREGSVHAS